MKAVIDEHIRFSSISRLRTILSTVVLAGAIACASTSNAQSTPVQEQKRIGALGTVEVLYPDGTYQTSIDGSAFSRPRETSTLIRLRRAPAFDPQDDQAAVAAQRSKSLAPELYVRNADNPIDAYIVQFHTQALPDYQQALKEAGVEIVTALPPNAVIGLMPHSAEAAIQSIPFVRATADYLPAYKLQEGLEGVIASRSGTPQTYSIMSVSKAHRAALVRFTESIGGVVLRSDPAQNMSSDLSTSTSGSSRFSADLTANQLLEVSLRPETLFIDVRGEESEDLDQVRQREEFDYIEGVAGYCGQGVGFEVYDRGYRLSHQELVNQPIMVRSPQASTSSGGLNHGTEIAGIMFAEGIAMSDGLLSCASRPIVFSRYSGFPSNHHPTEAQLYGHLAELVDSNGDYRAIAQTSSTDYSRTRNYTTWSAEYDEVLFELDLIKLQSQSNAGNRDSRPAAWAKNVVSVGGFHTDNTVDRSDDYWDRASIGPAADDRIKPDLSGQYGGIRTIDDAHNTAYGDFGGTSGATPTVGGAFGIMFQMWADGVFAGGPGQNRDVFDVRPHAATAKALMIHSAYRYDFIGGDLANMSRVHQGWGAPDLRNLYDSAKANGWRLPILVNEEDIVTPGGFNSYSLTVDGSQPLKATMVYRDLRGNPAAVIHRINDLSLKVTSPSGTVYWGNNGLRSGNWSTPDGNSNTIDTVENVFIQVPEAGNWIIEVLGDDIAMDGHTATPATDAVYALVATGGTSAPPVNQAPIVDAGADQSAIIGGALTLNGTVSDDGRPNPPGIVTVSWSQISGPGDATFSEPSSAVTDVTLATEGSYVLRLTAHDGELEDWDEVTVTVRSGGEALDFDSIPMVPYSNQDGSGTAGPQAGGATFAVQGDRWIRTQNLSFDITPDTVLEFDFMSTSEGEIHGIGFDEDNVHNNAERVFQIFGNQAWRYAITNVDQYTSADLGSDKHFRIPVGNFYTGTNMQLVVVNDKDSGSLSNTSSFSNVRIYEESNTCAVREDFESGWGGWTNSGASSCTTGTFVLGTPTEQRTNGGFLTQVGGDHTTGSGNALFTAVNTDFGTGDVDGGTCILESPTWQVSEASVLSLWYFHGQRDANDDPAGNDFFSLEVSTDGGTSFTPVVSVGDVRTPAAWTNATTSIAAGANVKLRIHVSDGAGASGSGAGDIIEAGFDDVQICPQN